MSTKQETEEILYTSMGFPKHMVQRAFRVYERGYGHTYSVEVLAEICVTLIQKEKAKLRVQQQSNALWNNELSYNSLNAKGLINCHNEWLSVKQTFYNKHSNDYSLKVLKWLRNQKQAFRNSYLSYMFISGYIGTVSKQLYIPLDIQSMLLSYSHVIFIKLYFKCNDNNNYELRTFDFNFTFNNLLRILQFEYNSTRAKKENFIRIWFRFGAMRFIYNSLITDFAKMFDGIHQIEKVADFDGMDINRWVELSINYYSLLFNDIDRNLSYNEILEIGVDIYDKNTNKYSFVLEDEQPSFVSNIKLNRLKWKSSLKIGDIVNVDFINMEEAFIFYKDSDTFYVYLIETHSIKYVNSSVAKPECLQPRYIYRRSTYWCNTVREILYKCDWITDFKKVNSKNVFGVFKFDILHKTPLQNKGA